MLKDGNLVRRPYLEALKQISGDPNVLKIVTGMRGVGKTTLMEQYAETLFKKKNPPKIVDYDFDGIHGFTIKNREDLHTAVLKDADGSGNSVIILHEVHRIPEWDKAVAELMSMNLGEFFITASDDTIMAVRNLEAMKDRVVEIRMTPLSLSEFMELNNFRSPKVALKSYMRIGGLPSVRANMPEKAAFGILQGVFCEAVLKDVLTYDRGLSPVATLNIAHHIMVDSGTVMDSSSVSDASGSSYRKSSQILEAMAGCYLIFENEGRSLMSKLRRNKMVYYSADIGLRNCIKGYSADPLSLAENAVMIELKRLGYSVRIDGEGTDRTLTAVDDESSTAYAVTDRKSPVKKGDDRIVITTDENDESGYTLSEFLSEEAE